MTYDANIATVDLQIERLRTERRRHAERSSGNQVMSPAIKMLIGDWYVDELNIMTREITPRLAVRVEHWWNNRSRLSSARAEFVALNDSSFVALRTSWSKISLRPRF